MYILASHGNYAVETLKSCEMITGPLKDIQTIAFHDPMGVQDVVNEYDKAASKAQPDENILILVDIQNGTPANAALLFQDKHANTRIFSGLSLGLVLSVATGTPIKAAIKENQAAIKELNPAKTEIKEQTHSVSHAPTFSSDTNANRDPIINVRIDARLIHGQVATMWTRSLNATRIMVIDDNIVKSKIEKTTLKSAVPGGVHLSILTAKGAADRIKANEYQGQRVFILIRDPKILKVLVDAGVKLPAVNVGNMSMSTGAKQIAKSVAVTSTDVTLFTALNKEGIELYHQMVPNDSKTDLMQLIKEGK